MLFPNFAGLEAHWSHTILENCDSWLKSHFKGHLPDKSGLRAITPEEDGVRLFFTKSEEHNFGILPLWTSLCSEKASGRGLHTDSIWSGGGKHQRESPGLRILLFLHKSCDGPVWKVYILVTHTLERSPSLVSMRVKGFINLIILEGLCNLWITEKMPVALGI